MLVSCGSVTLPDTEICAIKGQLTNGMFCSTTISRTERELTFEESVDFLHANEERGAALCQSAYDWVRLKNALEAACVLLGKRCKKSLKNEIKSLAKSISKIKSKSL